MKPPRRRTLSVELSGPARHAAERAAAEKARPETPPGPTTRMATADQGPTAPWPQVPDHIRPPRPRPRAALRSGSTDPRRTAPALDRPAPPADRPRPRAADGAAVSPQGSTHPPESAPPADAMRGAAPAFEAHPPGSATGPSVFGPRFGEIPTHPGGRADASRSAERRISAIYPAVPLVASIPILPPTEP